jgi:uncharacterized protein (TIGR02421 family)
MDATQHLEDYKQTVKALSGRIVEAQRPIRILDAIKWDAGVQQAFFEHSCREPPPVDRAYYEQRALPYDPQVKRQEFEEIARDIRRRLGQFNPLAKVMERMCREYCDVLRMLEARGTPQFSHISQQLYGSSTDAFHAGDPNLKDMSMMISDTLVNLDRSFGVDTQAKTLTGEQAAQILQERLDDYFKDLENTVKVKLDDGIISDAAAGADYIKVRKDARFDMRDVRQLEIHEGWVHLGTTMNGRAQPVCTFLSKGVPSSSCTQEGLAIITEIFHFASYPARVRRLTNRIIAVNMAEEGAGFMDVFRFFREQGLDETESYNHAARVFRGSTPDGKPFTKDLVYSKGLVLIYNFIRLAVKRGVPGRIPLLFCGKTTLEDVGVLADLVQEGLVIPPRFMPPEFADVTALTAWMCYSNFLTRLNMQRIESDYASLL